MAPQPKPSPSPPSTHFRNRMGLGAYTADPTSFPPSIIIYHDADFVAIHDKYPKSTIHALLLPRSPKHNLVHPLEAFQDVAFLAKVQQEVGKLRGLVAKELQRRLGSYSRLERERQQVLDGVRDSSSSSSDELPQGRNWEKEVICGVHAVPSMSHLHIHVLSRDMRSDSMRHRKHYNSFTTSFFVRVEDLPMSEQLDRRGERLLRSELRCWRCGTGFGNQFKKLKDHLEHEFEAWRRE